MAYRNKIYVAFDGEHDIAYYRLMKAWKANPNDDFEFYDAHDINNANDSSNEESIKRQLRERFNNSKMFILLIGEHTKYKTKFVKWEIETAIRLNLPIVCVNLNNSRNEDSLMPASLEGHLAIFIAYKEKIIKYAINYWPDFDAKCRKEGKNSHYHYNDTVYKNLGL